MSLIIQIVIAVIVVYLIFSVMVFTITEWLTTFIQLRGKRLKDAIFKLFNDKQLEKGIGEKLYKHPQIEKLFRGKKLPPYIPANNVAVALIDLIKVDKDTKTSNLSDEKDEVYQQYKEGLKKLNEGPLKKLLISVTDHTSNLGTLTVSIEKWFNDYMDRVSGWYKIHIRNIVLAIAAVVTVAFNIDTIHLVKVAATDKDTRERLNRFADELIKDSMINTVVQRQENYQNYYEDYVNDDSFEGKDSLEKVELRDSLIAVQNNESMDRFIKLNQMVHEWKLPVGWGIKKNYEWYYVLLGWILSTLALSAGAPFWFDLLKKLVNVRNAGAKPIVPGRPDDK